MKCGLCEKPAKAIITLGRDKRHLCVKHYDVYMSQNKAYDVIFQRAGDIDKDK